MNLFKEVADIRTRDTLDLKVPGLRDGNYKIVSSEPDWYTKQVMEEFVQRAERIHSGGVDPSEDNFLKITNDARLLGTDARLLYPEAPENPGGKLNQVADNVYEEYKRAEDLGIIGTQLVFSDIGTPKSGWNEEMLEPDYYKNRLFPCVLSRLPLILRAMFGLSMLISPLMFLLLYFMSRFMSL